jgi:tryptophan synthase alpha chain
MSRLDGVFQKPGHKALIGYVTAGYPGVEATLETVPKLVAAGCDIIELGIPFSDPLADGATIQRASYGALQNGVSPELCLGMAGRLSCKVAAPLVFMSYLNPLISYGFEDFCAACQKNGVSGLIIPDLPPEEGVALGHCAAGYGLT